MKKVLMLQLMLKAWVLFAQAQSTDPTPLTGPIPPTGPKDTIFISLDEYGKGTLPGFALVKDKSYNFKITIANPKEQHGDFLKDFAAKLDAVYDALEGGPYRQFYQHLWGTDVDLLKNECLDLANILKRPNPRYTLFSRPTTYFKHLLGKDFLLDALFDKAFNVACNIDDIEREGAWNIEQSISFTKRITEDTFRLQVYLADFKQNFMHKFYKAARAQIEEKLPARARKFYSEMDELKILQNRMDSLLNIMAREAVPDICQVSMMYEELVNTYENHPKVLDLKSRWMKTWVMQWIWLDPRQVALNPLGFTNEDLLPIRYGYDTARAKVYNQYRDSAIAAMLYSQTLNDAKVNYASFDSLLIQRGLGADKFDYRNHNESLKSINKIAAEQKQMLWNNINTIKFAVVEKDEKENYVYRHFDADQSLKGTVSNTGPAISNKANVTVAFYNLKPEEEPLVQEKPVEIKNESAAITQLNSAGDMLSGLMSGANPLPQILGSFLGSFRSPDYISVQAIRPQQKSDSRSGNYNDLISSHVIYNLTELGLNECRLVKGAMLAMLDEQPEVKARMDVESEAIRKMISRMLKEVFERFYWRITPELNMRRSVLALVTSPAFYTLPPRMIKPSKSKLPQFRNELYIVNEETKAVKKNLHIVVTNQRTGKEVARKKDSYKTAPTTRITPSIGVAWLTSSFARNEIKMEGGNITGKTDKERLRIMAGIHYHLKPMIQADDRFIFKMKPSEMLSRVSIFAGVSFPKPFYNLHPGIGVDLFTGVKLITTAHFYRFTNYTIMNGQIVDEKSNMVFNDATIGVSLEPLTFIKLIGVIK